MEVHVGRFMDWVPSGVSALAFNQSCSRLALARDNADIEIWDVGTSKWRVEKVIRGSAHADVRCVVWVGDERLFSGGLQGVIVEWDLHTLAAKDASGSYGGPVWSMAVDYGGSRLAVGCDDGVIRLFDVTQETLALSRSFVKQKGRVLSVAWSHDDSCIAAGGSDSAIRKFDVREGRALYRIKVGQRKRRTHVWCVAMLKDGSIVSGDSQGFTQVWDGELGTLVQSFREHAADVLSIAVSSRQDVFYATGVDNKIAEFRSVSMQSSAEASPSGLLQPSVSPGLVKWHCTHSRRPHTHDIRSLAIGDQLGMLVSAGVDTQHTYHLDVWRLAKRDSETESKKPRKGGGMGVRRTGLAQAHRHVVHIAAKGDSSVACSAISPTGQHVAYSDATTLRVMRITYDEEGQATSVNKACRGGEADAANALCFAGDSRLVFADRTNHVMVCEVPGHATETQAELTVLASFDKHAQDDDEGSPGPGAPVLHLSTSSDGQWCVSADALDRIVVYSLDALQVQTVLPKLTSPHTALALHPTGDFVVVVMATNRFEVYRSVADKVPLYFTRRREVISGASFRPSDPQTVMFHSHSHMALLTLDEPLPAPDLRNCPPALLIAKDGHAPPSSAATAPAAPPKKKKSKRKRDEDDADGASNLRMVERYGPLLHAGFVGSTVVVLERPWIDVMRTFPDPLFRKRFGT